MESKIKWNESAVIGIPEKEVEMTITSVEHEVKKATGDSTVEDKVKSKLKEITSFDVFKHKEKTSKSTKKTEKERGRTRLDLNKRFTSLLPYFQRAEKDRNKRRNFFKIKINFNFKECKKPLIKRKLSSFYLCFLAGQSEDKGLDK